MFLVLFWHRILPECFTPFDYFRKAKVIKVFYFFNILLTADPSSGGLLLVGVRFVSMVTHDRSQPTKSYPMPYLKQSFFDEYFKQQQQQKTLQKRDWYKKVEEL